MLVDTNLLIDYLRGKQEAIAFFENPSTSFSISVISISELRSGVRPNEESALEDFLSTLNVFDVTRTVAELAGNFMREFSKSHNVGIADALIGATAQFQNEQLASLNAKHFPMTPNIIIPY